jgi:hypothetical protein
MKKIVVAICCIVLAGAVFSACGRHKGDAPKKLGFTNPEDLARQYLQVISTKNVDGLKDLVITPQDLNGLKARNATKQHWQGYFAATKRLFLTKNKDLLGHDLTFLSFRSGEEIKVGPDVSVFRGAQILAEFPDKRRVRLELNFVLRAKGVWKVLFLRYLNPKANIGQGPKLAQPRPGPVSEPKMKVPGPKPKMSIKVKKVEKDGEQAEAPADSEAPVGDAEQSLDELNKLFGE